VPIAKGPPETGLRVTLDRTSTAPLVYEGTLETPTRAFAIRVEGDAVVGCEPDLAEKVRLIVRAALRHADADGRPAPPRITRWRP